MAKNLFKISIGSNVLDLPKNCTEVSVYKINNSLIKVWTFNKVNFVDSNGKYLFKNWFSSSSRFINGFASVSRGSKHNFIDSEGKLISRKWFDFACPFDKKGFAIVDINGKCNYITPNGKPISKTWFDWCGDFISDVAVVMLNHKYNFINRNGEIISEIWFDDAKCFKKYGKTTSVRLGVKWILIDKNGKLFQ